jgi:hypothetical protein
VVAPGAIAALPHVAHPLDAELSLLYVGISPAHETSRQTIHARVIGNHLSGNVGSSTFRFVLAALLVEALDLHPYLRGTKVALSADDNGRLSAWQREHLLLTWCARERPWEVESKVIAQLTPAAQFRRQRRACVLSGRTRCAGRAQASSARRLVCAGNGSGDLMISDKDVERLAAAARGLPPNTSVYLEEDFVMNLLETVLDCMLQTEVVVKALERFRENRWNEVRTLDDLERLLARFPEDQAGNTALAQYLWGYNFWTRAQQLRDLVRYFRSIGVVDQERLKQWAWTSTFKKDFEGRIKGLGPAVYQWLVMRQGVDTVKPDVHLRRFAEAAVGRKLNDQDVIELTSRAAARVGVKAFELDWRIWEASRRGALPNPTARA